MGGGNTSKRLVRMLVSGSTLFVPWDNVDPGGSITDRVLMPRQGPRRASPRFEMSWGAASKPGPMTVTRSGAIWTVSNSGQSIATEVAANTWAPSVDNAGRRYTTARPSYTNVITQPRAIEHAAWSPGVGPPTTTADAATSPDGQTKADQSNVASGQSSRIWDIASGLTPGKIYRATLWARAVSGTVQLQTELASSPFGAGEIAEGLTALTTTWKRLAVFVTIGSSGALYLAAAMAQDRTGYGGQTGIAQNLYSDLHFLAEIPWDAPYCEGTVGATHFGVPGAQLMRADGSFNLELGEPVVKEDATAISAERDLLRFDANNRLYYDPTSDLFRLKLGGTVRCSSSAARSFNANTSIDIGYVWNEPSGCGFILDGETRTGAWVSGLTPPGTAYLFSDGSTSASVFVADLFGDVWAA